MSGNGPEVQEVEITLTFAVPTTWSKEDIKDLIMVPMVKTLPHFIRVKPIREEAEIYSAEG